MEQALAILNLPYVKPVVIILAAVISSYIVEWLFRTTILRLAAKSETQLDDDIAEELRRPVVLSIVFLGIAFALREVEFPASLLFVATAILKTLAVWIWAVAAGRIGTHILRYLSHRNSANSVLKHRTLPFFGIIIKLVVVGWAVYFALLAWEVNVTGWLASAGVVGIAIGFAAKDTLANLFAGIFILADAPYKLGDFVAIDSDLRGKVTQIGIRSTRMVTRDGIEVTVPNAVIGNAKIVNESGGEHPHERIRATVFVAYGSDIDRVREVLLNCAENVEGTCKTPVPEVRFREMSDSGLRFQLLTWIYSPELKGPVLDRLNTKIYKALNESKIEIPYNKQDLYIKEMPGR
ncbi:MAG TPA: mechanosensitive ion channel family protein [Myxococcales bacterium]|nr:mechanosensitive ion channel family protein [Myxococcales bacterium]